MFDVLPYPNITASDSKEQMAQMLNYLLQLRETIEFELMSISAENLSPDLKAQLDSLGADIKTSNEEREEQLQQINNRSLTVNDVINSESYKASLKSLEEKIPTEYVVSAEQVQSSDEEGGINIYAFTDNSGEMKVLQVKNGYTPTIVLTVNFETGNLEYEQIQGETENG